ncbi:helix-turn-helix transcriptional regulator [Microbacterium foliorum]
MDALVDEIVERVTREVLATIDIPPSECVCEHLQAPVGVFTTRQAAAYCGLSSAQSLYNLISQGEGPTYFKQGRRNAFYESDLDEWTQSRLTRPSAR